MLTMPAVSVIIPVFNGERFIKEAIESVLAQTYQDFELIVVDDGSTDGTSRIVQNYPKVQYLYQSRDQVQGGQCSARNRGIHAAGGRYIAFLDCDDSWYPEKLAHQVPVLDRHPEIGVVYSDQERINGQGKTLKIVRCANWKGGYEAAFFGGHNLANSSMLVRKEILEKAGFYDEDMSACSDKDLFVRLFDQCQFFCVNKVLIKKRRHSRPFGRRHGFESSALEGMRRLQTKLSSRDLTPDQKRFLVRERALYYYACGKHHMPGG